MSKNNMASLENLCLDKVAQKFDRFFYAFVASKDVYLLRNLEFVQRRFSAKLATALYEKRKLKEEYFEFLINEHLNVLDGKWLKNSRYQNSLEDVFRRLPNLTSVCFKSCGDEVLENIGKYCPKIIEIDVSMSRVTDKGFENLYRRKKGAIPCPELKSLFVKHSRITDKGVESLIRFLPSLESIDYPNLPLVLHKIHGEDLSRYKAVHTYSIVKLNFLLVTSKISLRKYADILKACFTVCPKLESLACCITTKRELDLFMYSHLKKLHLQFKLTAGPSLNIDSFLQIDGYNLTSLKLSDCSMSASKLASHCPSLREFDAYRVNFTDIFKYNKLQDIFPSLRKCTFSHIDASSAKAVCLILSSSPRLESVSFISCMVSLEIKNRILMWCKNPSAKKIDFLCFGLEIEFLRDILRNCTSLKEMCLTECYSDVYDTDMQEMVDILQAHAKTLPNKPKIVFCPLLYENLFGWNS